MYWVGAVDWHVRDFHGYLTQRGTTYNAYLVMGEKITLVDTVKGKREFQSFVLGYGKLNLDPDYLRSFF